MDGPHIDYLTADRFSALGDMPVLVVDAASYQPPEADIQAVIIGVDRDGALPAIAPAAFDVLLTTADAPEPWVSVSGDSQIQQLVDAIRETPMAATTLCRVLRLSEGLSFTKAIEIESLAYSALLGGSEFARWRAGRAAEAIPVESDPLVVTERAADILTLTLSNPAGQNAMTAAMRDALHSALANVLDDPSAPHVQLRGAGKCFSTGGSLAEFGTANDLAEAHIVRTVRSCAMLLNQLGERASVKLQGACIGSGLEIPAAAAHRIATADTWFQLPELRMGLIPGAGGTASIARAIGRHRAAWMVLSGKRINARQALDWGLIHEIVS
jgi:hypothetical protein